MAFITTEPRRAHRTKASDRFEYQLIAGVVFTYSLGAALVKRALGQRSDQPLLAEAKSVAHTVAGYAFQR